MTLALMWGNDEDLADAEPHAVRVRQKFVQSDVAHETVPSMSAIDVRFLFEQEKSFPHHIIRVDIRRSVNEEEEIEL